MFGSRSVSSRLLFRSKNFAVRTSSSIQVLLLQNLEKKGSAGDTIKVRRGYARNYLIPNKIAAYATESNKEKLTEKLKSLVEDSC